jgi:hypothetical protein
VRGKEPPDWELWLTGSQQEFQRYERVCTKQREAWDFGRNYFDSFERGLELGIAD